MKEELMILKILRQLLKVQTDQLLALLKMLPADLPVKEEEEIWLHTNEVMLIFQKTRKTIYNWRKSGHLRYRVNGGTCYYLKKDVYAIMKKEPGG
ncbi:helix-turn-helix domain-containing protein [Pedobacter sp. N36a]|uniref:helix-turn-helix domain-containing protein n=1 Tax=Pedobacter sp. N36a TaxID=2767996 RepID=UPI001656E9F7|nr:helix-turn-helix domain-containing protein [Pedobacter sp. N36a]MBC8986189.1 helix-turn-helix domain-containing protein [Pedobacter sp. N36a]